MRALKFLMWVSTCTALLLTIQISCFGQSKLYQNMNSSERARFVSERVQTFGRQISNNECFLTPSFETEIQASLDKYVQRLSESGDLDPRLTIERAQAQVPTIMTAFRAQNVSPLMGLYIAWIESEFVNLTTPNAGGAIGLFQILPQTGMGLGLTPDELLDVGKAADAAARYLANSMNRFQNDGMKETLAVLAYNRGDGNVKDELQQLANPPGKTCSICALSAQRAKLNPSLQKDSDYVARFFAAAIFGENPQAFGLSTPPISSFGTGN